MIDIAAILAGTSRVLLVGILLGAGLPLLFSVGMILQDKGSDRVLADGTAATGSPAAKAASYAVFAVVALVVLYGILFITKGSINHYLGIQLPI